MLTNGTILQIEPERLLKHSLLNANTRIISVLTIKLHEENGRTTPHASENFTDPINDKEYADAVEGWDAALMGLKDVAEK